MGREKRSQRLIFRLKDCKRREREKTMSKKIDEGSKRREREQD